MQPSPTPQLIDLHYLRNKVILEHLPTFIRKAWPYVEPSIPLNWNWHHDVLCDVLTQVTRGEILRLIINIPPGTSKSIIASVLWPAWEWLQLPHYRYLTISYTDDNTIRDNRRVRSIVTSQWYKSLNPDNPLILSSDQQAKIRFDTTQTGFRIATSIGGMATGEHPHRIIIDDPIKVSDARSKSALHSVQTHFDETISTRVNLNPAFIIIMQRLHQEDLTGYLLDKNPNEWEHLMLPMRFDPKRADPRDIRTKSGELLWPSNYDESRVKQLEIELGEYGRAGQLDQNPIPEGGTRFKREWFTKFVDRAPDDARICRGWDVAGTKEEDNPNSSRTAGVKIAEDKKGNVYVCDCIVEQDEAASIDNLILATAQLDGYNCLIREDQEPASAGKAVIAARRRTLRGFSYDGVLPTGDKVTRADPFRSAAEGGKVYIVRGDWNKSYIDILCNFPHGKYLDEVDATSCAYNSLVQLPVKKRGGTWGGR